MKDLEVDWSFARTGFPEAHLEPFASPAFDRDPGLGLITNKNYLIETPQEIANGIRTAMKYVAPTPSFFADFRALTSARDRLRNHPRQGAVPLSAMPPSGRPALLLRSVRRALSSGMPILT